MCIRNVNIQIFLSVYLCSSETVCRLYIDKCFSEKKLVKMWKSIHKGPIARLALSQDCTLLATGGTDSSVRIWDLMHHACTHNLVGLQGVVR